MDPAQRFAALVEVLVTRPGVGPPSAGNRRGFGSAALTVDGSIFAMVVGGGLVLKLPRHRVEGLVAAGTGLPFAAANGTPMREWVALDHGTPESDLGLAEEALEFVRAIVRSRKGS
jgi:TfoX N-terminal domain